jgi:hypothetical protein
MMSTVRRAVLVHRRRTALLLLLLFSGWCDAAPADHEPPVSPRATAALHLPFVAALARTVIWLAGRAHLRRGDGDAPRPCPEAANPTSTPSAATATAAKLEAAHAAHAAALALEPAAQLSLAEAIGSRAYRYGSPEYLAAEAAASDHLDHTWAAIGAAASRVGDLKAELDSATTQEPNAAQPPSATCCPSATLTCSRHGAAASSPTSTA